MKDLTIVIPFYNESGALKLIQKKINNKLRDSKKIFLNDGSTDNSIKKLVKKKNTQIISNRINSGYGFSLKKGMALSKTKYIAWFDADNEHKVDDLLKMYRKIKKDNLDAVSPSTVPSSSEIRVATVLAATRRGWVWPIMPSTPRPSSRQILGIWVVFPEPVSPHTTTTWFASIALATSSRASLIGSPEG